MENPLHDLELLMLKVEETRDAQNHYFANRGELWLAKSKVKEKELDQFLKTLRRKGYNPDQHKTSTQQEKLF